MRSPDGGIAATCTQSPWACRSRSSASGPGRYDSAFTQKTYVHASEEDLQRGQAALARIHKIAWGCEKL